MEALVTSILQELNTLDSPYFKALKDGSFDRDDFLERLARLPRARARRVVVLGEGARGLRPRVHEPLGGVHHKVVAVGS